MGSENVRTEIANLVGKMTLTNDAKDYIARKGGQILVNMPFSSTPWGRHQASEHCIICQH